MQSPQFQVHAQVEQHHWWFVARRSILLAVLHAVVPPAKKHLVVDVGCGTGANTAALAKQYTCIGIDPILEAITFAKQRFPGVEFITGYAPQDIPEQIQAADAVLLMDVLEHIEDDFQFVSSLLASMKPGAHLFIMAPAGPNLWSAHDKGFEHFRRYTVSRLRMLWDGLPVQEALVSYCNARLYPLVKLTRLRKKAIGPNSTDLQTPSTFINTLLRWVFSGEKNRLLASLWKNIAPYKQGVSVLAVLQRTEGDASIRTWPENVPPDERPWMQL